MTRRFRRAASVMLALATPCRCRKWLSPPAKLARNRFLAAFIAELRNKSSGVVLDVGANDGSSSDQLMRKLNESVPERRTSLIMFEPQQEYHARLRAVSEKWHGLHVPKAAWVADGIANFTARRNAQQAGLSVTQEGETQAHHLGMRSELVQTVDLAAFLRRHVRAEDVVLLKLDIEGAEYELVPRLLVSGVLCSLVRYVLVEWHLNTLPAERRLDGLALRLALRGMIERGCGPHAAPRLLQHEEYRGTNFGSPVPGLFDEAVKHAGNGTTEGALPHVGISYAVSVSKRKQRQRPTLVDGL